MSNCFITFFSKNIQEMKETLNLTENTIIRRRDIAVYTQAAKVNLINKSYVGFFIFITVSKQFDKLITILK